MRILIPLLAASFYFFGFSVVFAQQALKGSCVMYNEGGLQALSESPEKMQEKLDEVVAPGEKARLEPLGLPGTFKITVEEDSPFAKLVDPNNPELIGAAEAQDFCDQFQDIYPGMASSANLHYTIDAVPNDPKLGDQWALESLDAFEAWDKSQGGEEVIVAVIDTGVDYNHEDLKNNSWLNPGEIAGNGIDDDGNGYVDDMRGWDFINGDNNPMDDHGHGTHCAGIIASQWNNGIGTAGISAAGKVKVMALKFLGPTGGGSLSGAVDALGYLKKTKEVSGANIRIASNSWGGGGSSPALKKAFEDIVAAGIIPVAAAGNAGSNNDITPTYPANYESVVAIASYSSDNSISSFSNYGQLVEIAAPGAQILSTYPNNQYRSLSGTSMATPYVAGALGLLLSAEPSLSNSQALYRLYSTAKPVSNLVKYGYMNLNGLLRNIGNQNPDIPVEKVCDYTVTSDTFQAHAGAQAASVAVSADEYNFKEINLQDIGYELYGSKILQVWASPNGLVHTLLPSTMDYKALIDRLNAIIPFNTDMVSDIRIFQDSESVVIYWDGRLYGSTAEIHVFLTLHKDYTRFDVRHDKDILEKLKENIRVGIAGDSSEEVITYAFNESYPDSNEFALIFTPECEEVEQPTPTPPSDDNDGVTITDLKYSRAGKNKAKLVVTAASKGTASLNVSVDGVSCGSDQLTLPINSLGSSVFKSKLPNVGTAYTVEVSTLDGSSNAEVRRQSSKRSSKRARRKKSKRRRSLSSNQTEKICRIVTSQTRSARKSRKSRR